MFRIASLIRIILRILWVLPLVFYLTACATPPNNISWQYAGVTIDKIEPGSSAAMKGLSPGDRIVSIGAAAQTITSVTDLLANLEALHNQGQDALLFVYQDAQPHFVALGLKTDKFGGLRFGAP